MSGSWQVDHQTVREGRLRAAFEAALSQHTPVEPGQLIATLEAGPDAWNSLHRRGAWDRATDALLRDLDVPVLYEGPLSSAWGDAVAWALASLGTWSPSADPHKVRLSAALVVLGVLAVGPWPWPALPNTFVISDELVQSLRGELPTLVGTAESTSEAELWEAELIEQVLRADVELDWQTLDDLSAVSEKVLEALCTPLVRCATTLLAHADIAALVPAAELAKTPLKAQALLEPLSIEQRLEVAVSSASPLVALAAIELSCVSRIYVLPNRERSLMQRLFCFAAEDNERWGQWMRLLNRYPERRLTLQSALGGALAELGAAQWRTYVETIEMRPVGCDDRSRVAVGACLAAFRAACAHDVRQAMWKLIFARWSNWNFAANEEKSVLLGVRRSGLDYGVIAYFNECLDAGARQVRIDEIAHHLTNLRSTWFHTRTDFDSAVYRLESALQPVCIADQTTADEWLSTKRVWALRLEEAAARYRELHLIDRVQ